MPAHAGFICRVLRSRQMTTSTPSWTNQEESVAVLGYSYWDMIDIIPSDPESYDWITYDTYTETFWYSDMEGTHSPMNDPWS